jgi:Tfp pilus assembly protein PilO
MKENRKGLALRAGPLITLGLGAAALAYLFCVFLPAQKALRALQAQSREKQTYIAQVASLLDSIAKTQAKIDEAREYADNWRRRAPEPDSMGNFLSQVTQSAQASGVETLRLDPQQPQHLQTVEKLPYEIEVEGSYRQVFALLVNLEQMGAPSWVEELRIESTGENSEELQCELKMAVFAGRNGNSD